MKVRGKSNLGSTALMVNLREAQPNSNVKLPQRYQGQVYSSVHRFFCQFISLIRINHKLIAARNQHSTTSDFRLH